MEISKYIDHTLLKATATEEDIITLCDEAIEYNFFSVCVNGCYVKLAKERLKNSDVKVAAVVGFPLGAMDKDVKIYETEKAVLDGASEIDMVINVGYLKSKKYNEIFEEISGIKSVMGDLVLKVILETCYLDESEKRKVLQICLDAGADFVKTSTGFGTGGATIEDIKIMKEIVDGKALIKASGGIKNYTTAKEYIDLGVKRIGTSSGIAIVTGKDDNSSSY